MNKSEKRERFNEDGIRGVGGFGKFESPVNSDESGEFFVSKEVD